MALAQAKRDALDARIAGLTLATQGWLGALRGEALARLTAMGMPGRRDEYWRYTDPSSLTSAQVLPAALFDAGGEAPLFDGIDRLKIVFVDGVFDPAQSDDLTASGLTIERLAEAAALDIHWARDVYGVLEARGQTPVQRPLAAMNTAFATDGILIRATGKAAKPVSLIYQHKSETSDAMLHHCIKVETGAEVTILENGPAAARMTKVMEVEVADGGRFHHVRAQGRDHERRAATHLFARLGSNASFKSFTMTANGRMTRNDVVIELNGADSAAHVAGAALGDGDFHHDDTVFITHAAERCESRQVFKKV